MTNDIPVGIYPVVLVQDRYQGVYSGGAWLAICNADCGEGPVTRINLILSTGPSGSDREAGEFWSSPPAWIAVGNSPDCALAQLLKNSAGIASE